jgi:hypothetical protein
MDAAPAITGLNRRTESGFQLSESLIPRLLIIKEPVSFSALTVPAVSCPCGHTAPVQRIMTKPNLFNFIK